MEALTVSELNRYVKLLLNTDDILSNIWVKGEISGLNINALSGHVYFSLSDEEASVRAVCFKSSAAKLRFVPKSGMQVIALGRVSLFERDGQYQLIVEDILPQGQGSQSRYFRELEKKLRAEGLFEESRKRKLARFPKTIAIITAKGSAALADIVKITSRRWPLTKLVVFPVLMQGMKSESSIVGAINMIKSIGGFDTVIIARGGGSKEDLLTFNSESIVRSALSLSVPFISAVGHETDVCLLDYAADVRASTPSAAAELAVPDMREYREKIVGLYDEINSFASVFLYSRRLLFDSFADENCRAMTLLLQKKWNFLNEYSVYLNDCADKKLDSESARLRIYAEALHNLSPLNVMRRGYGYVVKEGMPVNTISALKKNDKLTVIVEDGFADCEVTEVVKGSFYDRA